MSILKKINKNNTPFAHCREDFLNLFLKACGGKTTTTKKFLKECERRELDNIIKKNDMIKEKEKENMNHM